MSIKGFQIGDGTIQKYDYPELDNKPTIPSVDATLTTTGTAADAKATGDALEELSSALNSTTICKNILGLIPGHLYPCYIPAGSKITMSTSDGSSISVDDLLLRLYDATKTQTDYFKFTSGLSHRTVTTNASRADTYYVALGKDAGVPIQVEIGENATTYEERFLTTKELSEEFTLMSLNEPPIEEFYDDDLESGYYSSIDGSKQTSSTYIRSKARLRVLEKTAYYSAAPDVTDKLRMDCYDENDKYINYITINPKSNASLYRRSLTPLGTVYGRLYCNDTTVSSFSIYQAKYENIGSIEYPYEGKDYIYLEECYANGDTGALSTSSNIDVIAIPTPKAGDRWFVSNTASAQFICLDSSNNKITAEIETVGDAGKIVTIPSGTAFMYCNLYRTHKTGISGNDHFSDYICKITKGKILAIGDSITWLDGKSNYGGMTAFSGWQRQLRLAGYDVRSAGYSGNPYATGLDIVDGVDYSIYKEIVTKERDVTGYDYVIMFGGTNDVLYGGALGDRPTNYSNRTFDASKFNGAIGAIISYIRTNNPVAKILIASFPKSEAVSRSYPDASSRVNEIENNAEFWSCRYINIFRDLNIQPTYDQFELFFYDSTHPNYEGMQRIGKLMLKAVENYE